MVCVWTLVPGTFLDNSVSHTLLVLAELALGPAGARTFTVNVDVNELFRKRLEIELGVEQSSLSTAGLVEEEGVNKDHAEDGKDYLSRPVVCAKMAVDTAHLADAIVRVNHAARVEVHL